MHIILLKFSKNKAAAPEYMEAHNAWIAEGLADGVFKCVGSLDVGGGFILAHGEETEPLMERVKKDPFVVHEVVSATCHHVDVKRAQPELSWIME